MFPLTLLYELETRGMVDIMDDRSHPSQFSSKPLTPKRNESQGSSPQINLLMKYRVHYTFLDQTTTKVLHWIQREKDFNSKEEARVFSQRIAPNIAVRNINIQPIP
jgi:hypothetical protein